MGVHLCHLVTKVSTRIFLLNYHTLRTDPYLPHHILDRATVCCLWQTFSNNIFHFRLCKNLKYLSSQAMHITTNRYFGFIWETYINRLPLFIFLQHRNFFVQLRTRPTFLQWVNRKKCFVSFHSLVALLNESSLHLTFRENILS